MKYLFCFLFLISIPKVGNAGEEQSTHRHYEDRERGYFWYEDPVEEVDKKDEKTVDILVVEPLTSREILKKQGEDWEDSLATAILNPDDPQAMKEYMEQTFAIQARSATFADSFKKTIWSNPEFDSTLVRPVSTQAIAAKNQQDNKLDDSSLNSISEDKGLLFFFKSDCPYCHRFAPILKKFAKAYGFSVIPVSLDAKGLPDYPYPKKNFDMGKKLNVSVVPALFLIEPETNTVATVGYGYNDYSTLVKKVLFANDKIVGKKPSYVIGDNT